MIGKAANPWRVLTEINCPIARGGFRPAIWQHNLLLLTTESKYQCQGSQYLFHGA